MVTPSRKFSYISEINYTSDIKISNGNSTDFETLNSHEISRLDSMIRGVGKGRGSTAGANPPPQMKKK